jgi:hypothetical protein
VAALNAEQHMVSNDTEQDEYDRILNEQLDPQIIHSIAALRFQSDAYLNHVLA